ncbi:hypothetical protein D3C77_615450 [compost metagenome]
MPGDVAGGVAQEIIVAQLCPQLFGVIGIDAALREKVQRGALGFADQLLAVQGIFQAAVQGALGFLVQLAQ